MSSHAAAVVPEIAVAIRSIEIMVDGALSDFEAVVHPDGVNRESAAEPAAARGKGPAAWYASAEWLRGTFADLHYEVREAVANGPLVAVHATMSGRQIAPFITYTPSGEVGAVFAATGRSFAVTQTHWFRVLDGQVVEHWANRDDLGQAEQLGWVPPTPRYLVRSWRAKRRAQSLNAVATADR